MRLGFATQSLFKNLKNTMEKEKVKKAMGILKLMMDPINRKIIEHLKQVHESTVTDIYCNLKIPQSECSNALMKMARARIVNVVPDGRYRIYSINEERIEKINLLVTDFNTLEEAWA